MGRAARSFGRSSRLDEAAASGMMRACRAHGRAADSEHARYVRGRAKKSRVEAQCEARLAAAAAARAGRLMRDADGAAACAAACAAAGAAGAEDGFVDEADLRGLSLAHADMWEDAKHGRLVSSAKAEKAAEVERLTARVRRISASAANLAADAAAAAAAAAAHVEGGGSGERGDPGMERAVAAWRRAVAAANRSDAAHPSADSRAA